MAHVEKRRGASRLRNISPETCYYSTLSTQSFYGMPFNLAIQSSQERQANKRKLIPRLLGVTKDSVLRLDERTKEILKTWPLTTVRRWVASPNVFTLDFGDYQDQYYSVQTTEGEHIHQLIAGYIDIILKHRDRRY